MPSFSGVFFASIKSITQWSTVRGYMHRSKGVFAMNLLSEFYLKGESVVWLHSHATAVLSLMTIFCFQLGLEWVLVIFRNQIYFQKMRTLQFHKCKTVESLENKQFVILELHKWLSYDYGRLLWIGHLLLYKTLLFLFIKHLLSFLWVQVSQAYWMQTFNNSELQPRCS